MSDNQGNSVPALSIRYAMRTDRGLVRESNQDTAYAGARLLAVADGFGVAGEPASAAAIDALKPLDTSLPASDLLNALADAVERAGVAVGESVAADSAAPQGGTTLTALVWSGAQLAMVHVGDSRVYLLRGGELFRITHDHTVVQSLIDEGKLTDAEAASHPQRSILLRALHGGPVEPDLELREAMPGDRYLLCSDGLHTVVETGTLREVLATEADPDAAVRRLVELAISAGAPDNVSCVVADVIGTA